MANCRMEIKIQIAKCEEAVNPTQQEDGLFVYTLTEDQALSIDTCEQTLLTALFPIVRETLAQHFSAVSLERAQAAAQSSSEVYTRFTPEGAPSPEVSGYDRSLVTLPMEQVTAALAACAPAAEWKAEMESNPVAYEDPACSVLTSVDEVGVKQQRAPRGDTPVSGSQPAAAKERKRVHHTVLRIEHSSQAYILTAREIVQGLRLLLAFLLHNNLFRYNLVFFVDGQRTLQAAILSAFSWFAPLQIILDWYHLMEKCRQQLSLALKGRGVRNAVLRRLSRLLWYGCVSSAITTLQEILPEYVKDPAALDKLIGYLERNRPFIPCYAVRKKLGLCNSSQAGEKANDLVVSARQKHNGMSWRERGSAALASISALVQNR